MVYNLLNNKNLLRNCSGTIKGFNVISYRLDIRDIKKAYELMSEFFEQSKWKAEAPINFLNKLYSETLKIVDNNKPIQLATFSPSSLIGETEETGYPAKYANRYKNNIDKFIEDNFAELESYIRSKNIDFFQSND